MGAFGSIFFLIVMVAAGYFYFKVAQKKNMFRSRSSAKQDILNILNTYGLTFFGMTTYFCKYVGGHPERDNESNLNIFFWKKDEKLIFFEGGGIYYREMSISAPVEGSLTPDKVFVNPDAYLTHLFDIQISSIQDIRYFDATTSSAAALVGGNHWAIPVYTKNDDASVLIDWNDGRYNHSTEFRFAGLFQSKANKRANTLRNTLIKMTK